MESKTKSDKRKLLSKEERRYYQNSITRILEFLKANGACSASCIVTRKHKIGLAWQLGERRKMLQVLNTLHSEGLINRIDKGFNFTDWEYNANSQTT